MKKIVLFILFVMFTGLLTNAQEMPCNKGMMKKNDSQKEARGRIGMEQRKKMAQFLQLTEDQKTQMKAIRQDFQKKMDALDQQQNITVKEYNDRKTQLRKELQSKREALLTKEQKDKIATARELKALKQKEMFVKRMAMMKDRLDLTDDQVKQLKALHEKNSSAVENVKKDNKLNDQEKKMRLKSIKGTAIEERKKILNEEQLKKLASMKKNRKNHAEPHRD